MNITVRRRGSGGLARLAKRLEVTSQGRPALNAAAGVELGRLVDEAFDTRTSPEGVAWAPRVPPTGSHPLLEETGRMRASKRIVILSDGAIASLDTPAEFHRRGTRKMVARAPFPRGNASKWNPRIRAALVARLRELLTRGT